MPNSTRLRWVSLLLSCAALLTAACRGGAVRQELVQGASLREVPDPAWRELAAKRLFFGHQSVGDNIMEGVGDLVRAEPRIGLRVARPARARRMAAGSSRTGASAGTATRGSRPTSSPG